MDSLRLQPPLLLSVGVQQRDHCLPSFCSIQQNTKRQTSLSNQRIKRRPTVIRCQKFSGWKYSYPEISHRSINTSSNASMQALQPEPKANDSAIMSMSKPISTSLNAFYRFSRPHTVIGTALSIFSVSLLAVESLPDISPLFLTGLLEAVVSALFMNIYIVGLNQLSDIDIDKVNKPTLPLASGEYSPAVRVAIASTFAAMSFGVGFVVGSMHLLWALFVSFVLGTAYSINLPYFRWKRSAIVSALCIVAVRAMIVQLAFFLHIQTFIFRRLVAFSRPLIFATAFMTFFSVVIALFKDIPDIEGDPIFGILSFSVRLGQKKVFWICVGLLEMAYVVAMSIGASSSYSWCCCPCNPSCNPMEACTIS
uniref:Uncharacterized protein n=1 Tax=Avena sativa TaxID=4498 RepID=A0ACD5UXQ9_AVESA